MFQRREHAGCEQRKLSSAGTTIRTRPPSGHRVMNLSPRVNSGTEGRQFKRLVDLESAAAKLPYRNIVLTKQNRGLTLAVAPSEAVWRPLEPNRRQWLGATKAAEAPANNKVEQRSTRRERCPYANLYYLRPPREL
jgi:hypothetical protein